MRSKTNIYTVTSVVFSYVILISRTLWVWNLHVGHIIGPRFDWCHHRHNQHHPPLFVARTGPRYRPTLVACAGIPRTGMGYGKHSLHADKFTWLFYVLIQLIRAANYGRWCRLFWWCRWWLQSNPLDRDTSAAAKQGLTEFTTDITDHH